MTEPLDDKDEFEKPKKFEIADRHWDGETYTEYWHRTEVGFIDVPTPKRWW